jgi:hypothetical protein
MGPITAPATHARLIDFGVGVLEGLEVLVGVDRAGLRDIVGFDEFELLELEELVKFDERSKLELEASFLDEAKF